MFASSPDPPALARIGVLRLATRSRMRSSRCDIGLSGFGSASIRRMTGAAKGRGEMRARFRSSPRIVRVPLAGAWDARGADARRTCWTLSAPVLMSPAGVGAKVTCSFAPDAGGTAFSLFPYIPGVAATEPPMPLVRWGEKGGAIDRASAGVDAGINLAGVRSRDERISSSARRRSVPRVRRRLPVRASCAVAGAAREVFRFLCHGFSQTVADYSDVVPPFACS